MFLNLLKSNRMIQAIKYSQIILGKSFKFLLLSLPFIFSMGCKNLPTIESKRTPPRGDSTSRSSSLPDDDYEDAQETPLPSTEDGKSTTSPSSGTSQSSSASAEPKIGVIIGPGFLRSFIAVGILQEFHRARIPIHGLIGFEWGSLPAALYSLNAQSNEVEWQMLKMNEASILKKTLIRNQIEAQPITELKDFFKATFNQRSFEQSKIPFMCLSFDYKKRQHFWMKKGSIAAALPYCLASPPFSKPYANNVGTTDLKLAVDDLKQKGANYIIFIDALSAKNELLDDTFSPEARVLWSLQQAYLIKSRGLVDHVIDTSSAPYSLLDFGARRDMIRKGQEIGQQEVKKLATKLRL